MRGETHLLATASLLGHEAGNGGYSQSKPTAYDASPLLGEVPKAIYRSDTHPTNMVVLTYELKAGAPIIIPIARDRQIGRGPLVNELVSMYAKTGPDPTRRWRCQGLLLWEKGGK